MCSSSPAAGAMRSSGLLQISGGTSSISHAAADDWGGVGACCRDQKRISHNSSGTEWIINACSHLISSASCFPGSSKCRPFEFKGGPGLPAPSVQVLIATSFPKIRTPSRKAESQGMCKVWRAGCASCSGHTILRLRHVEVHIK